MIALNGQILAQGPQFSLSDVEVITATVDLEAVRAHRMISSRRMQSAQAEAYDRVWIETRLDGGNRIRFGEEETKVGKTGFRYHTPEEEIAWVHFQPSAHPIPLVRHSIKSSGSCGLTALGFQSSGVRN